MKKISLIVFLIGCIGLSTAQEQEQTDSQKRLDDFNKIKKHELSLDVLAGLAIPAISPRYEYVLGRYSGVGVDLFFALNNDDIDFDTYEKFSITPYYRQYFFSKEDYGAKGFYGEGFVKFYSYEYEQVFFNDGFVTSVRNESFFETAIGAGIGWKWVSDSGFLIDVGFGLGRNLGISNDETDFNNPLRLRGGVNFGWRF